MRTLNGAPSLRVLLIGSGRVALQHQAVFDRTNGVDLAGILDPFHPDGSPQVRQVDEVAISACDAVDICAPTYLHQNYVLLAARWQKPVYCEGPPALSQGELAVMINTMRGQGVPLTFSDPVRQWPVLVEAARLANAKAVGASAMLRVLRGGPVPRGWDDWYRRTKRWDAVMIESLYPDVAFALRALGSVQAVYLAHQLDEETGSQWSGLTMRFCQGSLAYLSATWTQAPSRLYLEVAGTAGLFSYDSATLPPVWASTSDPIDLWDMSSGSLQDWLKGLRTGEIVENGAGISSVMDVLEGAARSLQLERPVAVGGPDAGQNREEA